MAGAEWMGGWLREAPPVLPTSVLPRAAWLKAPGIRSWLEYHDCGLAAMTGGLIGAQHVRFVGGTGDNGDWHFHDLDWQFSFMLAGTQKQVTDDLGEQTLVAGDASCLPAL